MNTNMHRNFKSTCISMPTADLFCRLLNTIFGNNLDQTVEFLKKCPPSEKGLWQREELRIFKIEMNKIDRLYHVDYGTRHEEHDQYNVFGRMDYESQEIFFNLQIITCDHPHPRHEIEGKMYLTYDPEVFLRAVLIEYVDLSQRMTIWKSMVDDGIVIQEPSYSDEYNFLEECHKYNEFPTMKYLSHKAYYDHYNLLKYYANFLPDRIATDALQFIKIRRTQEHLRKCKFRDESDAESDGSTGCTFEECSDSNSASNSVSDEHQSCKCRCVIN